MATVNIIGAGLAGCEACWQTAKRGVSVRLFERKPKTFSPAHHSENFAELVCSNSLKAMQTDSAAGLLKAEMRLLDSVCMQAADQARVPAGGALAVDRERFSAFITEKIEELPNVSVIREEIAELGELPPADAVILATGPLTAERLAEHIRSFTGASALSFFDAAAPVLYADSIDQSKVFRAARYGKGGADYLNCPMTKEQYLAFLDALLHAETAEVREFDDLKLYEGCMPVESMAKRGVDTLRFGPLKPVGLTLPGGGNAYAVVQLRQDNAEGTLYNIVGFQTRLKFGEQKRVFGMIPGLERAEYARYGVMHRNTYLRSPGLLNAAGRMLRSPGDVPVYFAGQITGVEGYMESAASGIVAGINAAREVKGETPVFFPEDTVTGALMSYISSFPGKDFQPMGANFGILRSRAPGLSGKVRDKALKKKILSEWALQTMTELCLEESGRSEN